MPAKKQTAHGFSADGREYVIREPHPPRDWYNYLWNDHYLASVSQHLTGNSLYQNDAGVVTNLFGRQDDLRAPRAVYVRDRETGRYWSAGFHPCCTEHSGYRCRHGLGYSELMTRKYGVRVTIRIFVPRRDAGEIWTVRVTNESKRTLSLQLFSVADIALNGVNMPYGYLTSLHGQYLRDEGFLFCRNTSHNVVNEKYSAFMYATRKPDRWDASRDAFLGPCRNLAHPQGVEGGRLANSVASVEHLVGALQHNLRLKPGGSFTTHVVLGVVNNLAEARKLKRKYRSAKEIDREFEAVRKHTASRIGDLRVETPDADFNRLFNIWQKHQLHLMADWARFYFKGYRDTCQDAAGMSIVNPERAVAMLKMALRNQRSDGFCPRAFRVASMDIAAADKHYADSPSWISHATDAILRETGDLSLLNETVPFSDGGSASVWEHNLRAADFLWDDRGRHGLSLMHYGDWNDLMDKVGVRGVGESVWMSFALARVLDIVASIAEWRDERQVAARYRRRYVVLRKAILRYGWDGRYFLAAINDEGMTIGTSKAREGRVFINPQSWAMLSGVVNARKYTDIAEHIEPMIDTPVGPVHSWPPFTKYQDGIGQLSGTPPGFFTNGNVYCHAAAFKIAADYEAGRTEKAFDTLMKILPSAERSEPYAQANGYIGATALRRKHHVSDDPWRTGTVAWNFLNVFDRLLGFERDLHGFRLNPRLPARWKRVRLVRPFRGRNFHIDIRRGRTEGLWVDGELVEGGHIRVAPGKRPGRPVEVLCVLAPGR